MYFFVIFFYCWYDFFLNKEEIRHRMLKEAVQLIDFIIVSFFIMYIFSSVFFPFFVWGSTRVVLKKRGRKRNKFKTHECVIVILSASRAFRSLTLLTTSTSLTNISSCFSEHNRYFFLNRILPFSTIFGEYSNFFYFVCKFSCFVAFSC